MIDTSLRHLAQPAFDRIGHWLLALKIRALHLTLLGFVTGIAAGGLIGLSYYKLGLALLILSGLFDVLDGSLARLAGTASPRGAFLDLIFDRLVEAGVILGFYASQPDHTLAYLLFLIAVIFNFSTFMVAGALWPNQGHKSMHYDIGLVERSETFLFFFIFLLWPQTMGLGFIVLNSLIFLTGIIRTFRLLRREA